METPATIRRNPPRKAKMSSTDKSTAKHCPSGRKRFFTEGKALMPSFTAAEESCPRTEQQEHANPRGAFEAESLNLDPFLQQIKANLKDAEALKPHSSTHQVSTDPKDAFVAKNPDVEPSVRQINKTPKNAVEAENSNFKSSVEQIAPSSMAYFEAENPHCDAPEKPLAKSASEKLHVYLRIRPARVVRAGKLARKIQKVAEVTNRSLQNGRRLLPAEVMPPLDVPDVCLLAQGSDRVTLVAPALTSGPRKPKAEEFNGFSHIFSPDSTQEDVFDTVLAPRLVDLLKGESSLVVAMGPTSAGKTYTMLGSPADPGLLPRSFRYLLDASPPGSGSTTTKITISMFEIYSEQVGRSEKILDLLQDGAELSLQQSKIKGVHEAIATTVEEADAIFVTGLQRRTTASTAANDRSSRSHCIINISTTHIRLSEDDHALVSSKQATLTIADLAGFERERKTGNQGVRLNESNFINNTSMVFGQCLRALLEHQKNPKKTLQKHFQYSMLTRYLKPYMEAKGNMTLIINVSPCEEDYLDTAFVLRQAAPYSNIKLSLLPPKEIIDKPALKKRGLLLQERQPIKKQRKVDEPKNADKKHYSCVNANTTQTREEVQSITRELKVDLQNPCHELDTCQGEAVGLVDENVMQDSGTINKPSLCLHISEEFKLRVLTEVDQVLLQEQVENFVQVSHAVSEILDKAINQHYNGFADFEGRLQQQHEEIILLTTNLFREQKHTAALSRELEDLKNYCKDLENQLAMLERGSHLKDKTLCTGQRISRLSVSEDKDEDPNDMVPPLEEDSVFGRSQKLRQRKHEHSSGELPIQTVCSNKLTMQTQDHGYGQSVPDMAYSRPSVSIQTCTPKKLIFIQDMGINVENRSDDVPALGLSYQTEHSMEQTTNHDQAIGTTFLADHSHPRSNKELDGVDCVGNVVYSEHSAHQAVNVQDKLEMDKSRTSGVFVQSGIFSVVMPLEEECHEEQVDFSNRALLSEDLKLTEVGTLVDDKTVKMLEQAQEVMGANNTISAVCTHIAHIEDLQVSDSEENTDMDASMLQNSEEVESLQLVRINSLGGQTACQIVTDEEECYQERRAPQGGSNPWQEPSLLPGNPEEDLPATEEQVKVEEQVQENMGASSTFLEGDCETHLGDLEACDCEVNLDFKSSMLEHDEKAQSLHLQGTKNSSGGQTTYKLATEEDGSPESYLNKRKGSYFQKGRRLALSVMRECKIPCRTGSDDHDVHHPSSTLNSMETLGPIGLDLEEILEIPLIELEKEIWTPETAMHLRLSDLLEENGGVLDIRNFSRKYSQQRSICIRYCLAVICGKMNFDGKWLPLTKENMSSRKRHFYATIQARTVAEAAGHARAGFQEEVLLSSQLTLAHAHPIITRDTERQTTEETGEDEKKTVRSKGLLREAPDNTKENNKCCSALRTDMPLAPAKRRRLQPLSSLSLHTGPNTSSDLEYVDVIADEVHPPTKSYTDGHASTTLSRSKGSSLAYLLTRHKK